jgi:ligand-binding sensor domain-containing protein
MRNPIIILFLILYQTAACFAQDYPIQKYTTHQGLAQMQVYSVLKDSRGIVWAGTGFGLSRFNGETFTNYTTADGLLGNHISDIKEDTFGYIWIICGNKGLVRFDGNTFKAYPNPKEIKEIRSFSFDKRGRGFLMIADKSNKRNIYEIKGDTILPLKLKNSPKYLSDSLLGFEYFSKFDCFIAQIGTQLYSFKNEKFQKLPISSICSSLDVVFKEEMVFSSYENTGKRTYYSWNGLVLTPFIEVGINGVKVLSAINNDFIFVSNKSQLYFLPKHSLQANSLGQNPPIAINKRWLNQPDGATLWLPTEKGLWQLTRKAFRQFSEQQVPYCWGVVEDKNKDLYFLNYDVSLQKYDGNTIKIIPNSVLEKKLPTHINKAGVFSNGWYYKPLMDKYKNIWLPHLYGIFKYDYKNWSLNTHKQGDALAFCIAEDKQRNKIVASGYNQLYTVQSNAPNGIEIIKDTTQIFSSLILSVVVAPNNDYWFSGKGISRYSPDSKQFSYYNLNNHKLPAKGILGLYFDWQGTLWAMSWDAGLYRFNAKKDNFERVLGDYFNGVINLMEQIDEEHLLIGTLHGIYIFNLKTFNQSGKVELKAYNQHNGFMGLEPGQLGSFRDSKGYVWITSGSVLTRMNPKELDLQKRPIKTFITKIGNYRVPFVGEPFILELPDGQNTASFTVESIGEDKPFRSEYSFRIKGVLDEWSEWQEQNLLMVNNLPNGVHTIEVRSRLGTLDASKYNIAAQKFYVSAPFYKSPNFYKYASFIGLLFLLIMAYFWSRERRQAVKVDAQRKHIEEQENKVRFLQVQTIQAQMNPHFTFNVLGTLQHLILNNDTQKANENLLKLSSLIRNYLEASLLGDDEISSLFKHEIVLSREIELLKMYVEFEQLQYANRFEFEITLDGKLNPNNYRVPPLIIQPFIENAIKHGLLYKNPSEKGNLWVHFLSLDEDTLICTIEDDGVGRAKAAELQQASFKKYKSRGTELVKRRVGILNEMGYDIHIKTDDRLKGGTVVTIRIGYK